MALNNETWVRGMVWIKVLLIAAAVILVTSCDRGPDVTEIHYPDDAEIADPDRKDGDPDGS